MAKQIYSVFHADDDDDDCLLFEEALNQVSLSINLTTLRNGQHLMQSLVKLQDQLPDLLFLDLNMPGKNGFECLTAIKQNEKLKALTVIILSTSFEQAVVNQLIKNGADYYFRKPTSFNELKKILHGTISTITQSSISQGIFQPAKEQLVFS